MRHWTKEEMQYLDEKWGETSLKRMSQRLNRSELAIKIKAFKMKLGAFLDRSDYVTYNQVLNYLGVGSYSYKNISWIQKRKFPVQLKKVGKCSFKIVYLEDFWEWASENRHFIDWTKVEKNCLGDDPKWLKELRENQKNSMSTNTGKVWTKQEDLKLKKLVESHKYTLLEISKILKRNSGAITGRLLTLNIKSRPVRTDNHVKYTENEKIEIERMILNNSTYDLISIKINKSEKAIRGYVYRKYGSENLDKVRKKIENGVDNENIN